MSLINDALKQARQSQQPNQADGQLPLRPVAAAPPRAAHWMLPLAVIALVGASVFFIWLALAGRKTPAAKAPELSASQPAPPAPAPPVAIATNTPVVSNNVAAAPSLLPPPKLQGIIYGRKSWAIVDGNTVYVGDSVDNFRVKEITPNSITLVSPDGSEKKLVMGE
ncbi:MAG TPA: hypothetical protein VIK35_04020 [Verrucomicrobiae bacterium]